MLNKFLIRIFAKDKRRDIAAQMKETDMKYEPVKYNSREEAAAALHRMVQRKRELEKRVQAEFVKARKDAENCYASI